jgi:competence protein ComEC
LVSPTSSIVVAAAASLVAVIARRVPMVPLIAVGLSLGAACAAWHVWSLQHGLVVSMASQRADVDVVARLVRDPVDVTTVSGSHLTVVDATVVSVLAGGWRPVNSPVLVLSYGAGWDGLLPGQRVEVTGKLAPRRRGDAIAAVLDARSPPLTIGRPPWWQRAAGSVRSALRRACAGLPADERGLLPGLVDGDVAAEPANLTTDMRRTGLTHLQAVSGENVSVVLGVTLGVARAIGLRRRSRVAVASIALLGFVVLARPSPSVLRAAVMGGLVLLALLAGRRLAALQVLAVTVLGLVCIDPFLARSVGFVLSVSATAGILIVAPRWATRLARHMPMPIAIAIAVPAAAQLACTPVLVMAFGQLTPYAIPANLLAAPAVVPATVLGVVCAALAPFSRLATATAWLAAAPTAIVALVAHTFATLPGAGTRWPAGPRTDVIVATVFVVAILWRLRRRGSSGAHAILGRWPP